MRSASGVLAIEVEEQAVDLRHVPGDRDLVDLAAHGALEGLPGRTRPEIGAAGDRQGLGRGARASSSEGLGRCSAAKKLNGVVSEEVSHGICRPPVVSWTDEAHIPEHRLDGPPARGHAAGAPP